jgi:hypothetical protein
MTKKKRRVRRRSSSTLQEFSGSVVLEPIFRGSKSERMAVKLDTGDRKLLLRRLGIGRYRDEGLEDLVGQDITCQGLERGGRIYLKDFEVE